MVSRSVNEPISTNFSSYFLMSTISAGLTSFMLESNSNPTNQSCLVMLVLGSHLVRGFGQIL